MECKLCQRNHAEATNGICNECMDKLGIIEMPPVRRPPKPCLKCNGLKFIRVIPREHTFGAGVSVPEIAPMTLTQKPAIDHRLFGKGMTVASPSVVLGDGMLETFTCLACGFVEWWVEDPSEIPIGPEFMSDLVDYTPDEAPPYR